jgi:hypothetical protein
MGVKEEREKERLAYTSEYISWKKINCVFLYSICKHVLDLA